MLLTASIATYVRIFMKKTGINTCLYVYVRMYAPGLFNFAVVFWAREEIVAR